MSAIEQIKKPVATEMKEFENHFRQSMRSSVPLLDKIAGYLIKRKGKQLRPLFVFLSASLNGTIGKSTFTAASLIELLHTATLVHDDIVDDSYQRRGFFSLNALWKNKIAVLVGDYLLSRGLLLAVDNQEYKLLQIVSFAVKEMSEGELLQIEKTRGLNVREDIYFEIIRQKTASLIASCCGSGAASVGASDENIEKMKKFGELTGIAFQIKDDLLDYADGDETGKPTGIDIREKKLTLPVIYTINNASRQDRKKIISTIKHYHTDEKRVKEVISMVMNSGGLPYSVTKMKEYRDQALDILNTFPDNEARKSLHQLVNFTIERNK